MIKSVVLAVCVVALVIIRGEALKCYVCEESCKNETTCDSSKFVAKGQKGLPPPYDRCLVRRETTKDGTKTETRQCAFAYQCHVELQCSDAPKNSTCEIGCCDSDLCNSDSLVTSSEPSKPFEPSGSDLSCYSCSDLPVNNSVFKETTSCSKSPKHSRKCSPEVLTNTKLKQDRCLTLKIQVKEKTGELKEMLVRNCSGPLLCDYSNALWAYAMNQSMGTVVSAQASCCSGNLCESKINENPTKGTSNTSSPITSLSSLLAFIVVILISLFT